MYIRIVSGSFLAIKFFFQEEHDENKYVIEVLGLSNLIFRQFAFESLPRAGLEVKTIGKCFGKALPTPAGQVIEGAGIDAVPVTEITLEWNLLLNLKRGKTN